MPRHEYDTHGSSVSRLANDYVQIVHVMPSTETAGVLDEVCARLNVIDALLADAWEPLGGVGAQLSATGGSTALVETWVKRERHLKK